MYEKFRHASESKMNLNPFFKPKLKTKLFQLNPAPDLWVIPLDHEWEIPLRLDSRVILYNGTDTGYSLYESYAVKGGAPITQKITEWHPKKEIARNEKLFEKILERRSNLNGAVIRYSWFHNPPFVRFVKDGSGSVVNYVGFYVDIFEELKAQGGKSMD